MLTRVAWWLSWLGVAVFAFAATAPVRDRIGKSGTWRRATCAAGVQSACVRLGWNMWTGYEYAGINQDLRGAKALYERACAKGNARGCMFLADVYSAYPNNVPRPDDAAWGGENFPGGTLPAAYTEAEERNRAFVRQLKDDAKARQLLQTACTNGEADACWRLGDTSARRRGADGSLAMWWIGGMLLALSVAVAVVRQPAALVPTPRREARWFRYVASLALAYGIAAAGLLADDGGFMAWLILALAALMAAAAWFVRQRDDVVTRRLLTVAGFLALPVGLMLLLISREVASAESARAP